MRCRLVACVGVALLWMCAAGLAAQEQGLRPPSVPLVVCDPYFSVWSSADRLSDAPTVHWTGRPHSLGSMLRVDGQVYRLMGAQPAALPAMPQTRLEVLPTRTLYTFQNDQLLLTLSFTTPALPEDLDLLSRPITYLTWQARSIDGKEHSVSVYFDASAELAVNTSEQAVSWSRPQVEGLSVVRVGSVEQNILARKGDNLRIDWGYLYAAAPQQAGTHQVIASRQATRDAFVAGGNLPASDDARMPRAVRDEMPVLATVLDLGKVGPSPASRYLILAYDDLYSIKYMNQRLRPYWRRSGKEAADLLKEAAQDYAALLQRCTAFDQELMKDLAAVGGQKYAQIGALAYRQCLAGNKVAADANGQPLVFPKENFSNGCIATVDVIYPMAPQFLVFYPALAKGSIATILEYAASPRWKFPFAPHDMGTYPIANGQVYGGGERTEENQMPVEESGNMLLLLAAIARIDGNADFAAKYWPQLTQWAEYLKSKGLDPENQLCTDDFAGHLAHNVNLSAKAILALGAYAMLCDMSGKKAEAASYRKTAEEFAAQWTAKAEEGDHYRLAFDKPGTWSQKYNLVWDRLLNLNLFPPQVVQKEMAFYRKVQGRYGLPLDNRQRYTKLDWIIWTATLTGSRQDFEALVAPVHDFLNESPSRVPMTDWYWTHDGKMRGFQARPVVGGVFIKLMDDPALWRKWASRGGKVAGNWAPLPQPPQFKALIPAAQQQPVLWRYTTAKPAGEWFKPDFADGSWKQGPAGFGTAQTPGTIVRTEWRDSDIWLRREFELSQTPAAALFLQMHHDEDTEVYINGVLAAKVTGFTTGYEEIELPPAARAALKPGKNILAVHCHQTDGGQYIDLGIVEAR